MKIFCIHSGQFQNGVTRKEENEDQRLVRPQFLGYDLSSFVLTPERESLGEGRRGALHLSALAALRYVQQ
jgi:hypothetical protein